MHLSFTSVLDEIQSGSPTEEVVVAPEENAVDATEAPALEVAPEAAPAADAQ